MLETLWRFCDRTLNFLIKPKALLLQAWGSLTIAIFFWVSGSVIVPLAFVLHLIVCIMLIRANSCGRREVDLSPLVFTRVEFEDLVLETTEPLEIMPTLDEDSPEVFLVAKYDPLNIYAYAPDRESLIDEIVEHLCFMWKVYAKEDPSKLTPRAQDLAIALKNRFSERQAAL